MHVLSYHHYQSTISNSLSSFHIAADGIITSQNQPGDLPYVFAQEIQNQNMNMTVQLRKKQELGFFTLLNEETQEIRHKFIKQKTGE